MHTYFTSIFLWSNTRYERFIIFLSFVINLNFYKHTLYFTALKIDSKLTKSFVSEAIIQSSSEKLFEVLYPKPNSHPWRTLEQFISERKVRTFFETKYFSNRAKKRPKISWQHRNFSVMFTPKNEMIRSSWRQIYRL